MNQRSIENQLIAPVKQTVRTGVGRAGWKYTDEVYNQRWLARVMRLVVKDETGCWLWQGHKTPTGYGQTNYRGKNNNLHRLMYQVANGVKLEKFQYVLHRCDVRNCCNPEHLWVGTPKDNSQDCVKKRRFYAFTRTHCPKGHEYTPENTYYMRAKSGGKARNCKECARIRHRERYRKNTEEMRRRQRERRARQRAAA